MPRASTRVSGDGLHSLRFKEKLVARGGSVKTADLLRHLKTLQEELAELVQGKTNTESINNVAMELVSPSLISHKDKGVRILTACCLADILRLFVPTHPYDTNQLQDIFELLIRQLNNIAQIDDVYYAMYFYLLENLAMLRSLALIADLNNSEDLVIAVFTSFFTSIKRDHSKVVYDHMLDIMHQLLEEIDTVPIEVVDMLLEQCRPNTMKENPVAHHLALDLCNIPSCADRLQRYVCQRFGEVVLSAAKSITQKGLNTHELEEAHHAIKELHRIVPGLLTSVVPQLEEELQTDVVQFRLLATGTLGEMFAEPGSELLRNYPHVWKSWWNRRLDKNFSVRMAVLSFVPQLLRTRGQLISSEINEGLRDRLNDPEEKVRLEACRVITKLDFSILHHLVDVKTLLQLGYRCKDKKSVVRIEAVRALFRLWQMLMDRVLPPDGKYLFDWKSDSQSQTQTQTPSGDENTQGGLKGRSNLDELDIYELLGMFGWIPEMVLSAFYINDTELHAVIENAIVETVVHAAHIRSEDMRERVERLLYFIACLEDTPLYDVERAVSEGVNVADVLANREKTRAYVIGLFRRQSRTIVELTDLVRLCMQYEQPRPENNTQQIQKQLVNRIETVARALPDASKSQTHLDHYVKYKGGGIHVLILQCMDWDNNDLRAIRKNGKEAIRKIDQNVPAATETFAILIRRVSPFIFCKEMTPALLDRIQNSEKSSAWDRRMRLASVHLLESFLSVFPSQAVGFVDQIMAVSNTDDQTVVLPLLKTMSRCLRKEKIPTSLDTDMRVRLFELATSNTPELSGHAADIIICDATSIDDVMLSKFTMSLVKIVQTESPILEKMPSALAALSKIAHHRPAVFEDCAPNISGHLVSKVLMKQCTPINDQNTVQWQEFDTVDTECRTKVYAIRLLVDRVRGLSQFGTSNDACLEASKPVLRLLSNMLQQQTESNELSIAPASYRPHLVTAASLGLLKLYRLKTLKNDIPPTLHILLSLSAQHTMFDVRKSFIDKLTKYMATMQFPVTFISTLFLIAHEPELEIKQQVTNCVRTIRLVLQHLEQSANTSSHVLEISLARLLHLLAHHPDFTMDADDLRGFRSYIEFFFDQVASKENVSLLYFVCNKTKQQQDLLAREGALKHSLHVMCDVALQVIRDKCKLHQWPLQSFTGNVSLQAHDILTRLSSAEATEIVKQSFLPEEYYKKRTSTEPTVVKRTYQKRVKTENTLRRVTPPRLAKATLNDFRESDSASENESDENDITTAAGYQSPSIRRLDAKVFVNRTSSSPMSVTKKKETEDEHVNSSPSSTKAKRSRFDFDEQETKQKASTNLMRKIPRKDK